MIQFLTIQGSSKAESASRVRVARLSQNATHILQVPRPGSFHPEHPTAEGVQVPSFVWGIRRREECHGPTTCQRDSGSGQGAIVQLASGGYVIKLTLLWDYHGPHYLAESRCPKAEACRGRQEVFHPLEYSRIRGTSGAGLIE